MKKSNIILFFLLIFALVAIVAIQVKVKSSIENIEKFEQTIGYFNKLEIQTGWIVELNTDSLSSISLNNDSLLNLIHQSGDKLILKEYKHKSNRRNIVKLNNFNTQEISIQGNSSLEYYTK
ncbi:MAG: hypothetical protein C0597_14500 [Marinilabiliales bacterium]|nr:MAG: hypothetical protein C0597_14500 [Marinilabiliales bacterium]